MKNIHILALCVALTQFASGQQRIFNWVPANDETVRLDPSFYHNGRTYGSQGGDIHVDIDAQLPVTVAMATAGDWGRAAGRSDDMEHLTYSCVQQHVVKSTYTCHLPPESMVLVIRDERVSDRSTIAEMGEIVTRNDPVAHDVDRVVSGIGSVLANHSERRFASPNDVHIQYYAWLCVENCIQPEFQWVRQVKEKYELTDILKVYGGITPDHDGEQVSIKVKSPVPMAVAILPAKVAGQLYGKPDMFESAVENSQCQQRGVQSSTFQCVINLADGPQALVLLPEPSSNMHSHKKAEIEVQAVKCVANCELLPHQE